MFPVAIIMAAIEGAAEEFTVSEMTQIGSFVLPYKIQRTVLRSMVLRAM